MVEYGLMLALISVVCIGSVTGLGHTVVKLFSAVSIDTSAGG
jgi:Flp pilus assembly pilin Flp